MQGFIKAVGAGKKRARDLSRDEAREAMTALLGCRDEAQVGAFLLALRMKGETADELAGFVDALGASSGAPANAVDIDAHADGHEGRPTLLPAAAALAARAGLDVCIRYDGAPVRGEHNHVADVLRALGPLPGVRQSDLAAEHPALKRLVDLRARVGVRTFLNSVVKLWSPRGAGARVVGIFHGPYHEPMSRALALLGVRGLVVQAPGGLPEPPPDRPCKITPAGGETLTLAPLGDDVGPLPEVNSAAGTIALNRAALDGQPGPARKTALLGAAVMLAAAGLARDVADGYERVKA